MNYYSFFDPPLVLSSERREPQNRVETHNTTRGSTTCVHANVHANAHAQSISATTPMASVAMPTTSAVVIAGRAAGEQKSKGFGLKVKIVSMWNSLSVSKQPPRASKHTRTLSQESNLRASPGLGVLSWFEEEEEEAAVVPSSLDVTKQSHTFKKKKKEKKIYDYKPA